MIVGVSIWFNSLDSVGGRSCGSRRYQRRRLCSGKREQQAGDWIGKCHEDKLG